MRRRAFLRAGLGSLALPLLAGTARAESPYPGTLTAGQPSTQPLQELTITARLAAYSGAATLVLYDARKRFAGAVEGQLTGGVGSFALTPRGALGSQWGALFVDGAMVAENGTLFTLDATTAVVTGLPRFDGFVAAVRTMLAEDVLEYELNGRPVRGYRSPDSPLLWLRDHVYQGRGFRYFDNEVRSLLDAFGRVQAADGSLPDFLDRPDLDVAAWRTPVEADVEYLYVQGVIEAWQASGDDTWLKGHLDGMRRALRYSLTDPLRWDAGRQLMMRPFTIDTWDFEYGPTTRNPTNGKPAPRHWIDERTIWGTFHGDNTGLAHALNLLAGAEERVGDAGLAATWREIAGGIMQRLNALSWNGQFYAHHLPLQPFDVPGVDEATQLSLSNAIALNRGVLSVEQGQAIVSEYLRRLETTTAFAEWFSIDPPFPAGSYGLAGRNGELPGEYVNGGIMPLVGGELARGAFRHGYESYGLNILERYWLRMLSVGRSFLWYRPNGAEGVGTDETLPTDGWGASAMLGALLEGAAGIEGLSSHGEALTISPRWAVAPDATTAYVVARYQAGQGYAAYRWQRGYDGLNLQLSTSAERARVRLLLPPEAGEVVQVQLNGAPTPFVLQAVLESRYVVVDVRDVVVDLHVSFRS